MVIYQYDTDVVNKINAPIVKIVSEQRFWWTETALRIAKSNPPTLFTFIVRAAWGDVNCRRNKQSQNAVSQTA